MRSFLQKNAIIILLLVAFASRLPQLFNDALLLDGDECIVGLMAKHLFEGKEFPVYFYGQSYGFSLVELLFIDLFYLVFGISDIAVKLAMLSMWAIGAIFFYKTLLKLSPDIFFIAFCLTLVLILSPPWAVWSTMARGGYLTAFVLVNLSLYLLFSGALKKPASWGLLGILLVIIYESQSLWLPGLFPVLVYILFKEKSFKSFLYLFSAAVVAMLGFFVLKSNLIVFWPKPAWGLKENILGALAEIPGQVYDNLTGSYCYKEMKPVGFINEGLAILYTAFIFISLLIAGYFLFRKRNYPLIYVFAISNLLTLLYLLILPDYAPRYLLPLFGYALLLFAELALVFKYKRIYYGLLLILIITGACNMITFRNYRCEVQTGKTLTQLSDWLVARNIHTVFSGGGLLQWQIDFYSHERVVARFSGLVDRYPKYIEQVNKAFREGRNTAMITSYNYLPIVQTQDKILVDPFVVELHLPADTLIKRGFDLGSKSD